MKLGSILFIVCVCSLVVGCTNHRMAPINTPNDNATIKLAEAADSISQSLLELDRIQKQATPPTGKALPNPASYIGMQSRASVDWSGPIAPIVKRIAMASNYRLRILGRAPAIPVIVTISTTNAPLADILRDVDFQAAKKATIKVYTQQRVIELRYAKA